MFRRILRVPTDGRPGSAEAVRFAATPNDLRIGTPLNVLFWLVATALLPVLPAVP